MIDWRVSTVGNPKRVLRIVVRVIDALTFTYWRALSPSAQVAVQAATPMPVAVGQPQDKVGAGLAVSPTAPVPLITAFAILVESKPFCIA